MSLTIKICGITRLEDARHAVACGADWLGFIFYPPSARYIEPANAGEITRELPSNIQTVGVFVNTPVEQILDMAGTAGIDVVQCHGDEPATDLQAIQDAGYAVIKAAGIRTTEELDQLARYSTWPLLLDTPTPEFGGSGMVGDWELAADAASRHRVILAGGLRPANIQSAIRQVRPAGIDVSSGVEVSKGIKDHQAVADFIRLAREIDDELQLPTVNLLKPIKPPKSQPRRKSTTKKIPLPANDEDLLAQCEVDVFRAGGPGGQHQNTTDSAVRLTHVPSGIRVVCRETRSQHRNRQLALIELRERIEKANYQPKRRKKTRIPKAVREKRLQSKRIRSEKKQNRQKPRPD